MASICVQLWECLGENALWYLFIICLRPNYHILQTPMSINQYGEHGHVFPSHHKLWFRVWGLSKHNVADFVLLPMWRTQGLHPIWAMYGLRGKSRWLWVQATNGQKNSRNPNDLQLKNWIWIYSPIQQGQSAWGREGRYMTCLPYWFVFGTFHLVTTFVSFGVNTLNSTKGHTMYYTLGTFCGQGKYTMGVAREVSGEIFV